MKMTAAMVIIGSLIVYWASIFIIVVLPLSTIKDKPSENWTPMSVEAAQGHTVYNDNGCSYCHSLYIRTNDWGHGAYRIAAMGDYYNIRAPILGTERTGPDLSQEAGEHPDDWHIAHFVNPRYTSPISVMPSWEFLGRDKIEKLIAYMQYLGGKMGTPRLARQKYWKMQAIKAFQQGPDSNITWIHSHIPDVWRPMPNPYPATDEALGRGQKMYEEFCINCHGPIGDGQGIASLYIYPPPLNFTTLRRHLVDNKYIGGIFYYQIMNGITGTAMPYFKRMLESEKIWDVSNYVAVSYVGYSDADIQPKGIDAAYEQEYTNPFTPPTLDTTGAK